MISQSIDVAVIGGGPVGLAAAIQAKEGRSAGLIPENELSRMAGIEIRVFTATLLTVGGRRFLPVRTDKPVHKNQLKGLIQALAKLRVEPPVKIGQVIIHNILGTGGNLVATSSL
jgi:alkyl hydroperoxide reductase subunit AhpF